MQWQLTVARHPLYRLTIRQIEEKGRRAERLVLAHYKVNEEFDVVGEHVASLCDSCNIMASHAQNLYKPCGNRAVCALEAEEHAMERERD